MKNLWKSMISFALVVAFAFTTCSGVILASVKAISEMDTPVAKIQNDTYVPYVNGIEDDLHLLANQIESVGGYTYTSEEQYNAKINTVSESANINFKPVKQTITVMTTATGSEKNGNYVPSVPLPNAIVRIDGVPRFTDRNGQVRATLSREYAELFVEKNNYNPYIEFMDVTGDEKIIHMKKQSDDIDIYGVLLTDIEYDPVNLINSEFTIFPDALGDYIANMEFLVNVAADEFRLLMDSEVIYSSDENVIYDIRFTDDMYGKDFSVQVVYGGIVSAIVPLNLMVSKPQFNNETENDTSSSGNVLNPFDGESTGGIFGGFNVDIGKLLNINKFIKDNRYGLDLKVAVDMRKSIIYANFGFTITDYFSKNKGGADAKSDEEKVQEAADIIKSFKKGEADIDRQRAQAQQELNQTKKELAELNKNAAANQSRIDECNKTIQDRENAIRSINKNKKGKIKKFQDNIGQANNALKNAKSNLKRTNAAISDLITKKQNQQMSVQEFTKQLDSLKGFKKDYQESFNQHGHGFTYGVELLLTAGYNYRKQKLAKFALSVDGTIGYKWNGMFFAGFIPLYYTIHVQAGLKLQVEFDDIRNGWIDFNKFWEHVLLKAHIGLNGELGVGINGFLSVGFFAGAEYGISGYMFMPDFYTKYWTEFLGSEFEWEAGVRVKVFLLGEFEFGGGQYYKKDPSTPEKIIERNNSSKTVNFINEPMAINLAENVYDGSKPQIEKIGDNYVATWIDVEPNNDAPHAVLKYSVYKDGIWSVPQTIHNGGDDFYHDMYFDGKDLHITWQKINTDTDGDSLEQMCKNSEIYYAKFDSNTLEFNHIKQLTDDGVLDAAPRFVLQENSNQPLAIAWQKNTNDDIIGLTGNNSIVYSSFSGGSWSSQKRIYESDHYFSFVDTAYIDGKITSAFVEDMDDDLATDDRKLVVCDASVTIKTVGDGFATVNHPQFFQLDGRVNLTFYGDGKVYYSNDFNTIDAFDVPNGVINDTYKIVDNASKLYIYYNKLSSENISQVFASIYDKTTGKWQIDVCLTDAQNTITNSSVALLTNGDILTVYNEKDGKNETVSLGYNVKEIRKDFAIISAFYDKNVQQGDSFALSVGIQNTGDYPISQVELSAFGNTETIILDQPLAIGDIAFIDMNCVFDIKSDGKEIIKMRYENIERDYVLHTKLTDVSIVGNVKFDNFKEYYGLTISNASDFDSKVYIDIYYKGKVIETVEVFVGGNTAIEYTYSNDDFENGNYVYFVIRSDMPDKYESDNEISFGISHMAEKETVIENPYYEALQIAKSFAGVL